MGTELYTLTIWDKEAEKQRMHLNKTASECIIELNRNKITNYDDFTMIKIKDGRPYSMGVLEISKLINPRETTRTEWCLVVKP